MRDMFHNYDSHIDKKEYPRPHFPEEETHILEGDSNLYLVTDVFGNEIGIQAKYGSSVTLYFRLSGCVEGSCIGDFVSRCSINFQIVDYWHEVIFEDSYSADEVFNLEDETIEIQLNLNNIEKLKRETYHMNLSLIWPDGKYDLYTEKNGFLAIK